MLDGYGSFLGRDKGCILVRDETGKETRYPLVENEIGEVQIKSGNSISAGALATLGFWGINCLVLTQRGNPVAVLKSLKDDMHVATRIAQYEAVKSEKGLNIAKQIILSKIEGQNKVLAKYGLRRIDYSMIEQVKSFQETDIKALRRRLLHIEGQCAVTYFTELFGLLPESIRPEKRKGFKAYDGVNNLFNLAYQTLEWKVHIALLNADLEPFLGFVHTIKVGQPSLVCDFMEPYRYLIDDFVIGEAMKITKKDIVLKEEIVSSNRKGKRQYLSKDKNDLFIQKLNKYYTTMLDIPRIMHGNKQEFETLISEEALLFGMYLRAEKPTWIPRIAELK
jgi:CRISPR-associated protein Cas1